MLPIKARGMVIKGYSAFPETPTLLEPHHQIVFCHIRTLVGGVFHPFAEMQSMYSTAPSEWAETFDLSYVKLHLYKQLSCVIGLVAHNLYRTVVHSNPRVYIYINIYNIYIYIYIYIYICLCVCVCVCVCT